MLDLGPNAVFIWASFGVTLVVLVGLVIWLVATGHAHQRALTALEAQGIRRRSADEGATQ